MLDLPPDQQHSFCLGNGLWAFSTHCAGACPPPTATTTHTLRIPAEAFGTRLTQACPRLASLEVDDIIDYGHLLLQLLYNCTDEGGVGGADPVSPVTLPRSSLRVASSEFFGPACAGQVLAAIGQMHLVWTVLHRCEGKAWGGELKWGPAGQTEPPWLAQLHALPVRPPVATALHAGAMCECLRAWYNVGLPISG